MDPFNSRAERLAIRRFVVGVALVLALMMSVRARAAEMAEAPVTSHLQR